MSCIVDLQFLLPNCVLPSGVTNILTVGANIKAIQPTIRCYLNLDEINCFYIKLMILVT